MSFREISIDNVKINPFTAINKSWMLITAGNEEKHNTMTASWGTLGELWGHYVSTIYVRHSRYTFEFTENSDYYSLCFFDEKYRSALNFCGSKSGRDYDKDKEAGLTAAFDGAPYYEEAKLVFICRKLYSHDINRDDFIDKSVDDACYADKDYHRMYVGEIVRVLEKDEG